MNMMRKNNLYDVYNIFSARNNLQMRSCALFDSNNVDISCTHVRVNGFKLNNAPIDEDRFIQCDALGTFVTTFDSKGVPAWLRPLPRDIDVTIFNNDMDVLTYSTLCNFAVSGAFADLTNKPYLWDHHDPNEYCATESNLRDLYNIDTFYGMLNFNEYARCNIAPSMVFSDLYLNRLQIPFLLNQSGMLNDALNNALDPTSIPLVTKTNFGVGLLSDDPKSMTDLSTSYYLNRQFNILNDLYNSKNANYGSNVAVVIEYLIDNIGTFTISTSNLLDVDRDSATNTLELSKLLEKVSVGEEQIDFTDLTVKIVTPYRNKLFWGQSFGNRIAENYLNIEDPLNVTIDTFFFLHLNQAIDPSVTSTINIGECFDIKYIQNNVSDYAAATQDQLGILRLYSVMNTGNLEDIQNTFNINVFRDEFLYQENRLDRVVDIIDFQAFLEELYASGVDNGSNLMRFSCNLEEISHLSFDRKLECYNNLQLQPIVYTSDYDTLFNTPHHLSCFSNDSEFLSAYRNLSEFATYEENSIVRSNLSVGTLGMQDVENVLMFGSNLTMDFLNVVGTLSFDSNSARTNYFITSSDPNGLMTWSPLPEYNHVRPNTKGIVRMFGELNPDDESAHTISLLNHIHTELKGMLDTIRGDIATIRAHPSFVRV